MSLEIFLALLLFAFVASFTPGPNNLMLLASGVNFGFRRTIPHMLGIGLGFLFLMLCVGFGLGALLTAAPVLHTALKVAGAAYLCYLAWRIATSRGFGDAKGAGRPMSFLEAAGFQWVNPKAWMMSLTAMAAYTSTESPVLSVLIVGLVFILVTMPVVSVWTGFGVVLREWLNDPMRLRMFNITMAVLLVASLWPMLR
ncbi:MAG: LysE family translocator [Parvibaculaceae bacterium]